MDNRKMGTQGKLSVSVALCTYNSEKFVLEQLDSILAQSVLPDEIVVSDDASQDKTTEILKAYILAHSSCDVEIKLMSNEQNLGYSKNFERCFQECRGDIILSCDADDVWRTDKVEKMLPCFDEPSIVYAFHDAKVVDAELNTLSKSLYGSAGVNWAATNVELLIRAIKRQGFPWGMTMAFRASILERAVPFSFAHDGWIWMCALCTGGVKYVDEPLALYRRHGHNASGSNGETVFERLKTINRARWFDYPASYVKSYDDFRARYCDIIPKRALCELEEQIRFRRRLIPVAESNNRLMAFFALIKCYGREYQESRGNRNTFIADALKVLFF